MNRSLVLTVLCFCFLLGPIFSVMLMAQEESSQAKEQVNYADFFQAADGLIEMLDLENTWKMTPPEKPEKEIIIAVLDTGVDTENKYFKKAKILLPGADFLGDERDPGKDVKDIRGHGTLVAGVIFKIYPEARIVPVRVAEPMFGWTSHAVLAQGIIWAADNQARVICIPIGSWMGSRTLKEAIRYAHKKGCVIIASSGNAVGANQDFYPAAYYDHVISVTDVGTNGMITHNANITPQTNLAALSSVYSSLPGNKFGWLSGSSSATAVVAGVTGLLLLKNPQLTPDRVKQILQQTASPIQIENFYPFFKAGIVDPVKALEKCDSQLSDRAISKFTVYPEKPAPGQTVYITVTVENQGNTRLIPNRLQVHLNNKVVLKNGAEWIRVPALDVAGSFSVNLITDSPGITGTYIASVSLELQARETNIKNNIAFKKIEVTGDEIRHVEIVNIKTSEAILGKKSLDFILTVRNPGNVDEQNIIIKSVVDKKLPDRIITLKAGETKIITIPWARQNPSDQAFIFSADCYLGNKSKETLHDSVTLNFHFDPDLSLPR